MTANVGRIARNRNTSISTESATGNTRKRTGNANADATENQARMQKDTHSSVEAATKVTGIESINVTDVTGLTGIREKTEGEDIQAPLVTWAGVALELNKTLPFQACLASVQLKLLRLLETQTQGQSRYQNLQQSNRRCKSLAVKSLCPSRKPTGQLEPDAEYSCLPSAILTNVVVLNEAAG